MQLCTVRCAQVLARLHEGQTGSGSRRHVHVHAHTHSLARVENVFPEQVHSNPFVTFPVTN